MFLKRMISCQFFSIIRLCFQKIANEKVAVNTTAGKSEEKKVNRDTSRFCTEKITRTKIRKKVIMRSFPGAKLDLPPIIQYRQLRPILIVSLNNKQTNNVETNNQRGNKQTNTVETNKQCGNKQTNNVETNKQCGNKQTLLNKQSKDG